jgi:hypothetical protein
MEGGWVEKWPYDRYGINGNSLTTRPPCIYIFHCNPILFWFSYPSAVVDYAEQSYALENTYN